MLGVGLALHKLLEGELAVFVGVPPLEEGAAVSGGFCGLGLRSRGGGANPRVGRLKLFGQLCNHRGVLGSAGHIDTLLRVVFLIVELSGDRGVGLAVPPDGQPPAGVAGAVAHHGSAIGATRVLADRHPLVRRTWVLQKRHEALAIKAGGGGEPAELGQSRVDIHKLHYRRAGLTGVLHARRTHDQRRVGGPLEVGVLVPEAVVAELPAMVSPEDNHRVLIEPLFLESIQ